MVSRKVDLEPDLRSRVYHSAGRSCRGLGVGNPVEVVQGNQLNVLAIGIQQPADLGVSKGALSFTVGEVLPEECLHSQARAGDIS
jgi:hypothetical protein